MKGIFILHKRNNKIEKCGIHKLNYKKEKIIEESIKMFNDNDPCIIHQTYAINSLSFVLLRKLEDVNLPLKTKITIQEIPNIIEEYIDFNDDIIAIEIY